MKIIKRSRNRLTAGIVGAWIALFSSCDWHTQPVISEEDRIVHEIVALAVIKFARVEGRLVLQEKPSLYPFLSGGEDERKELQARLAGGTHVGQELAARFLQENENPPSFVADAFPAKFSVVLLSESKMKSLFKAGADEGWKRFYEQYDEFGMFTVSRPAFSSDGNTALMMVWHQSGSLQGEGEFMLARRYGGRWVLFRQIDLPFGISDASSIQNCGNMAVVTDANTLRHMFFDHHAIAN